MKRDRRNHGSPESFSVVPLLLAEEDIPSGAREALVENRLQDAAELLMQEYGLTCVEASDLLDVSGCKEDTEIYTPRMKCDIFRHIVMNK